MADLIDPTQTGNYPVILGDGLLGKAANDVFTGVRYNHKPPQPNTESNRPTRLKPSIYGQTSSYDLTIPNSDGKIEYAFSGARDTSDGQYVLYFDPERKAFILDRIDSTFNMNITRMPGNSDPDSLRRKYPHLDSSASNGSGSGSAGTKSKADDQPARPKPRAKSPPRKKDTVTNKAKAKPKEKEKAAKANDEPFELALPVAQKEKPKSRSKKFDEEEDDDEDDDGGLLLEYPGGEPKTNKRDFSPALTSIRRFDDFMDQRESEADDADGESEDEPDIADLKLPSPANNQDSGAYAPRSPERPTYHEAEAEGMDEDEYEESDREAQGGAEVEADDNMEDDLEKDLEMAFEAEDNSYNGTPANGGGDESEISEED